MRRGTKFLIGLGTAVLTYGTLTAFVGPRHLGHHGEGYGCHSRSHWQKGEDHSFACQKGHVPDTESNDTENTPSPTK